MTLNQYKKAEKIVRRMHEHETLQRKIDEAPKRLEKLKEEISDAIGNEEDHLPSCSLIIRMPMGNETVTFDWEAPSAMQDDYNTIESNLELAENILETLQQDSKVRRATLENVLDSL